MRAEREADAADAHHASHEGTEIMTDNERIYEYLYHRMIREEGAYTQLRNNVWWRRPDELDLLEQIISLVRIGMLTEITGDIYRLFGHNGFNYTK